MAEYQHFDGETYITFNIVYTTKKEVQLAVTNRGKISVLTYDLYEDENGKYFDKVAITKEFISKILR